MIDKKMSNVRLKEKAGFSANVITRLKRNEYVSIESIEKICRVMECGVDDILEFVPEKEQSKIFEQSGLTFQGALLDTRSSQADKLRSVAVMAAANKTVWGIHTMDDPLF